MSDNLRAEGSIKSKKVFALLAEFNSPGELLHGVKMLKQAGVKHLETHTPFPIHGMDKAMGLKDSRLGWIVALAACLGFTLGLGLLTWTALVAYPMLISGKPFFPWQAFVPITFEVTILFSAFGAVLGMLALNKLPRLHHPLFASERFKSFSSHGFFLSVEADSEGIDLEKVRSLLGEVGGRNIEDIEEVEEGAG